jgi:hypothetical protein
MRTIEAAVDTEGGSLDDDDLQRCPTEAPRCMATTTQINIHCAPITTPMIQMDTTFY